MSVRRSLGRAAIAREEATGRAILGGAAALALAVLLLNACGIDPPRDSAMVEGGDAARGREYVDRYGCGSCHVVPGVANADGQVGPPLDGIALRSYLGGILPNTPLNMVAWIRRPQSYAPGTAMPDLGVGEPAGRDIAAYLYTLR